MPRGILFFLVCLIFFSPQIVAAHEVYVLAPQEVKISLEQISPNPFNALTTNYNQFLVAAFLITLVGLLAHFLSGWLARFFFLVKLENRVKRWAPVLIQLTLLGSLLSCVYYNALFGPELPLEKIFGSSALLARALLLGCAVTLILGKYVRLGILLFILLFVCSLIFAPTFALAYMVYLGGALAVLLHGPYFGLLKPSNPEEQGKEFLIIRIALGCSLLYSAFFAKFLHSQLAIETINKFELTKFFPFDPLFVVLGAFLVESLIGLCLIFGYQIRLVSFVFIIFLTVSILFFQEAAWPHFILFGTALTLLFHGYDKYTARRLISKTEDPVL
ncbi:hypothetical protein A2631_01870 [Candidatus Daviesbacteria bacterium RIFCSPHIGHO2_01_FULL_44_29]|uniref:DoxX family protein n=1 Tax=Candidatus Daviesbacteria bacterium RIFCSPHIGHO2_02_FULL_43_12 TaxID=1797776 RepID=A0A1F5KJN5_9BACT|nr:MAG: hypothetical protein A2631_01870 [Candidatus Daviesbacteria bacterium RIFCSPHIGHO2_01_FULL_44_29]OGE39577.1 MAG: hypothetical protein A3E86_02035 [Candidatus Daviesbacteria bacterium RIFCSPHIGHO2_12_FULL_47_45]OGE41146.1 MAG: hypothetical protein A3D25_01265 [Candidatus Daviesbacteria bacterium RIFCSPHIGHO2_02_FULL_43_12]OGE69345.1 MAG: hypothetical protein A3B55_03005 [Candidatus Daviesbacteria bacterium RIFCSPLOWO2_01_FULL_43_15]